MEVLYERCCGIDVHKSSVAACILLEQKHKPRKHLRRFGCTTRDLRELAEWLRSFEVRYVAMESTGFYWKPVWNMLEEHFHMVLANAQHIKAVPGRKTDMMDCQWIAELLRHGLLRQLCSVAGDPRPAGSDANQSHALAGAVQDQQPHPEAVGERQHQACQHRDPHHGQERASDAGRYRQRRGPVQSDWPVSRWASCAAKSRNSNWRSKAASVITTGSCWIACFASIASSKPRSRLSTPDWSSSGNNIRNWSTRWPAGSRCPVSSGWQPGVWLPRSDRT